jgi:glutamine amidotransferase
VPVPQVVLEKLRNPETDASAGASTMTIAIRNPGLSEPGVLDVEAADDAAAFES